MKIDVYVNYLSSGAKSRKLPPYYREAVAEYTKRLAPHLKISLHFEKYKLKNKKNNARFIRIIKTGASISSETFAYELKQFCSGGASDFIFFIDNEDMDFEPYDLTVSLVNSDISMPLQIVLLYEQVYRAVKINNNEPYHR